MLRKDDEIIQQISQLQHVKRKSMWVGSKHLQNTETYVLDSNLNKFVIKSISYPPALTKIIDEILCNVIDQWIKHPKKMTWMKVYFNSVNGCVQVVNQGGIGIYKIKCVDGRQIYSIQAICSEFQTGENLDEECDLERISGGTNGFGLKACNAFSDYLEIFTIDSKRKKSYKQTFRERLEIIDQPIIEYTDIDCKNEMTSVTFKPCYEEFGYKLPIDFSIIESLLISRLYQISVCITADIYYNDNVIKISPLGDNFKNEFSDFCKMFFTNNTECWSSSISAYQYKLHNKELTKTRQSYKWDVCIGLSDKKFKQFSLVNGIMVEKGGSHIKHLQNQIIENLKSKVEKEIKSMKNIKFNPNFILNNIFLFVKAQIVNPEFSSQIKDFINDPIQKFQDYTLKKKDWADIWNLLEPHVMAQFINKENKIVQKSDGKKISKIHIPKLEDAHFAGTKKSKDCVLIITEGDSAKTFAMQGRSIIGPERYGVFSLKGKVLNVRDANSSQLANNEELNHIKQIIGLRQNKIYSDVSELRYGKIMLLTDSDCDGTHIRGLFINFIHTFWPSLLKIEPNFIQTLRTPIVKAIKGKNVLEFFTEQDYETWKNTNNTDLFEIKYFKGLGTSKKEDAKNTFRRMNELSVDYYYKNNDCDKYILLAFDKDKNNKKGSVKCSDQRKQWLQNYDKNSYITMSENKISFQDLINKELIHFSIYDNLRSIPTLSDGLKPSQKKILYYMIKKNITKSIKVAQLSGYVSAEMSYHHGEVSLQGAIINMAQTFIGSKQH